MAIVGLPTKPPNGPGALWRAPYASDPAASRGRAHDEPESRTRSAFQRDRDRIIHSTAFRRLKQKTQVFVAHESDHYRTRLTHSLEVSQIARSLARALGLDEDLAEALALAHDLGHPPFGHAGERALAEGMTAYGGFDHNAQTVRIVTMLEARYAEFDGLNLTWETLEGVLKHNGPVPDADDAAKLPWALTAYDGWRGLEPHTYAGLEAQVAAIADDIAYNNHDIDDGLAAGLFTVDQICEVPLAGEVFGAVRARYPGLSNNRLIHEAVRRLIGIMVDDCLTETRARLAAAAPDSAQAVRALPRAMAAFSDAFLERERELRSFLWTHMYRHYKINRKMRRAEKMLQELLDAFVSDPEILPSEWRVRAEGRGDRSTARAACDYIAGMTDGFAIAEYRRVFDLGSAL